MVLSFKVFHTKRCFTLIRLLISRVPYTNNPLSIRHCSVFTPCERIPLSTIYSRSPCGLDCAVLFVCLLIFRRLTNNGPIAVIGDTVLQISYSPPFLLVPRFSFQYWFRQRRLTDSRLAVWPDRRLSRIAKDRRCLVSLATPILSQMLKLNPERGKMSSGRGWGCPSVPQKISTPRESGHSSTATIRLIRAVMGLLAI